MSDIIRPEQVKMARAALSWGVKDLAEKSGVGVNSITRFEKGRNITLETLTKIVTTLAQEVDFIPENGGGAGVRLKK